MKKKYWLLLLVIPIYLVIAVGYHFLIFGRLGEGYRYTDNGDYYQEISRELNGDKHTVVPAQVKYYDSNDIYIIAVRKVINIYEYESGYDNEELGALEYFKIDKLKGVLERYTNCKEALNSFTSTGLIYNAKANGFFVTCI